MAIMPERNNFRWSPFFSSFQRNKPKGNKKTAAAATRKEPTSSGEKTFNPCLMRMKDVPQMRERTISKKMALPLLFSDMVEMRDKEHDYKGDFKCGFLLKLLRDHLLLVNLLNLIQYFLNLFNIRCINQLHAERFEVRDAFEVVGVVSAHFENAELVSFPSNGKI